MLRLETSVQLPISKCWAIHFRLIVVSFLSLPETALVSTANHSQFKK
jgi:hypothetical protein